MTAEADMQQRVFAFLTDPATHLQVRRIDTHAASVFLEGDRALKIKRAVRFPFLDYSTLEKRKAACEEEIRVNRPFAPQIYHRVVAITQSPQGVLAIDGDGTAIEYAVEMTRFDERQTLDRLAQAQAPDRDLVEDLAEAIAASHRVAPLAPVEPWIASIPNFIADSTRSFLAAACFPINEIDELGQASMARFERVRGQLEQRGSRGHVRRCHGDLHLANIALIDRKPVLFDAIEFDARIASVDVLYDLAFAIMDFIRYGRQAAANALLNRYLGLTSADHLDALAVLPLFLSLRAAIRAQVLLAQADRTGEDKADVLTSARSYFELARSLIDPAAPTLIAIGGLSGTGKSVLAQALAPGIMPQPGALVVRSDVLRKQLFHFPEIDRLPESAYRPEITQKVYDMLAQRAVQVLAQGHSVVVDAVFSREPERDAIANAARQCQVRLVGLFLVADLATRLSRVGRRQHDASDATPEVAERQEKYDIGAIGWAIIDAAGTPEQTLEKSQLEIAATAVGHCRTSESR